MAFKITSKNINQKFVIQVIFILEIKPRLECSLAKYDCFFRDLCVHFELLLEWECNTYTTTKELKKMAFRINSRNMKQAIDIQVTFIVEKKLQKVHFLAKNNTVFQARYASILNLCQDGNVHKHATTKELKKMAFRINSWNIKQVIGIQVTFITEKKLQKEHFLAKRHCLLGNLCVHLNPCQDGNVHTSGTTKEMKVMAFSINSQNVEQAFGIQVIFITEIKP